MDLTRSRGKQSYGAMPCPPRPANDDDEADRAFYRGVLHELIDMGMDLARAVHAEAKDQPTPEATASFDRIARAVRRTVLLARKLDELPPRPTRTEARREIIRRVEDRIQRRDNPEADQLRAEFAERLDAPDLQADLRRRPLDAIIDDICRDLGLETSYGAHPFQRRTPGDVARLLARAARQHPRSLTLHPRLE